MSSDYGNPTDRRKRSTPKDVDTALLRTFLAPAETRNFSRTGERVGRSQSAVSAQVQKLEELLGQRLFERDKRNVHLTHAGEQLQGYARQMLQLTDAMLERFDQPGRLRFGPVRLAGGLAPPITCQPSWARSRKRTRAFY
ncbi:MAG: LysR family transcriptional regulator [Rhodovibrio sp.]|nr:LysR family transcriptional regulator [Rhodovibrio sp.]